VKIFADGADYETIVALAADPKIDGFTTNPTLMHKSGVTDYEAFARKVLATVTELPISFETFADEAGEVLRQARQIAAWGPNVYVKVPVTNSTGISMAPVIRELAADGVQLNVTAMMTEGQVETVTAATCQGGRHVLSMFAGRIADTGRDPIPLMQRALEIMAPYPALELLWASPREVLNAVQAESIGVHIITMTADLLAKLPGLGKDLEQFSLETVQMFHRDAASAGLSL
jgi:transaldolase